MSERPLAIKLGQRRAGKERSADRITSEKVFFAGVQKIERVAGSPPLRGGVLRQECSLAKELLRVSKHRKAGRDRTILDVGFGERELKTALAITGREIDRENFSATKQIVR